MRYGQYFIEKNGEGVLAFINPHGFLDNPTFRGMRWHLLKTYDKIYTIDLHRNSKKKEVSPDGSIDENVFDIMQGVSINIFVKTGKKKNNELGKIFHYDLYGKRDFKYDFLTNHSLKTIDYKELPNIAPNYLFVQKNFEAQKSYDKGFNVNELFTINNVGIVTAKDKVLINDDKEDLQLNVKNYFNIESNSDLIKTISYRPFDEKYIYWDTSLIERSRSDIMQHFLKGENVGLVSIRRSRNNSIWKEIFISNKIISGSTTISSLDINYCFPLYLYPKTNDQQIIEDSTKRKPNLNQKIVKEIAKKLDLTFTHEKETTENTFAPIDILDYIYAVLHSRKYRNKYKEFLKIDFPKVPYPKDKATFLELVKLGGEIRKLHLLESPKVEKHITNYPISGDDVITTSIGKKDWKLFDEEKQLGRIWINETQYFDNIPLTAWEFYIGGYQPAQKWLKDRKNRTLDFDDILHYQKIIVALSETDRLMKEIDGVEIE